MGEGGERAKTKEEEEIMRGGGEGGVRPVYMTNILKYLVWIQWVTNMINISTTTPSIDDECITLVRHMMKVASGRRICNKKLQG